MEIRYSTNFVKNFNKRVSKRSVLEKKYKDRLALFIRNRNNPLLKDHKLIGKRKNFRAFSITGDVRVIYFEESQEIVTFIDIGSHNQVYK